MENNIFLVFSTCGDESSARRIARSPVEERLAACVSLRPGLRSIEEGDGELGDDAGCRLTAETSAAGLTERLAALRENELPEIAAVPVTAGLPGYLSRVAGRCSAPGAHG